MKDINDITENTKLIEVIFEKISKEERQRILGYAEGILAHSEKHSKSA